MKRAVFVALFAAILACLCAASWSSKSDASLAFPNVVEVDHGNWTCDSPQDGTVVIIHDARRADGVTPFDGVHLAEGCTGSIRSIIVEHTEQDGIKVGGARDLVIQSGGVWCGQSKDGIVHQDGIQAMAGENVRFRNFTVDCPKGNNGGLWVEWNKAAASTATRNGTPLPPMPVGIVCENCDLSNANAAVHIGAHSIASGARHSILHLGTGDSAPGDCRRFEPGALDVIDDDNICQP